MVSFAFLKRLTWMEWAVATRSRMVAENSPVSESEVRSLKSTCGISTWMSMRSNNGLEMRLR